MSPLVQVLLASAVLTALLADARQLCGKSLVKHVGDICRDAECDSLEDIGAKRKSYSDLALDCCSHGCSSSVIEGYCCAKLLDSEDNDQRSEPKPATNFEDDGVLLI